MTDRCGHNFCHACLVANIQEEGEWPCPECRTIQTKTIDSLTRARFVERAVEKFISKNPRLRLLVRLMACHIRYVRLYK